MCGEPGGGTRFKKTDPLGLGPGQGLGERARPKLPGVGDYSASDACTRREAAAASLTGRNTVKTRGYLQGL